ncbi:hypothetical protein KSP40_PGU004535 [Platanthera guangdongensis]|uniref:Uncharacterized protein n=1 Tax=Platanthera guangdongensis TaxID=2320717 RepID=A0ABR2LE14_9ASPA
MAGYTNIPLFTLLLSPSPSTGSPQCSFISSTASSDTGNCHATAMLSSGTTLPPSRHIYYIFFVPATADDKECVLVRWREKEFGVSRALYTIIREEERDMVWSRAGRRQTGVAGVVDVEKKMPRSDPLPISNALYTGFISNSLAE